MMRGRHAAPLATFVALAGVYWLTLAPGVTLWDSGEFLAAAKTLGVPHPAGSPLYILVAKCWSMALAPVFGFARAVNLLSAAATAAACGTIAYLFSKWTGDAVAGVCAGLVSGAMSTIWLSATETEVYGPAFLLGCILVLAADRAGRTGDSRWALLSVYLAGLAWVLHLSALVVVLPAAMLIFSERDGTFALPRGRRSNDGRRARQSPARLALLGLPLMLLGASCVVFLLIRARHDPAINQGNPSTLPALWDVVTRQQYGVRSFWPRSAPLYLQIGNLFEYSDWQLALGLSSDPGPSRWRTAVTVLFAALAIFGGYQHRKIDRRSWRAWLALMLVGSLGVILYLNMKTGPSFGAGLISPAIGHEARERDYFFYFAFAAWAGWAGLGIARLAKRLPAALALAPLMVAALPIALNWSAVDRSRRVEDAGARDTALRIISPLPPNAVMLAAGDNDTYPLWYLQQVEGVRRDVTVVTIPLLSAAWYRAELARRHGLLDADAALEWNGKGTVLQSVKDHAAARGRTVVGSPYLSAR